MLLSFYAIQILVHEALDVVTCQKSVFMLNQFVVFFEFYHFVNGDADTLLSQDRMPGDGYGGGGGYRPQPRPSAGGSSGRNLPPRLANQRQKQVTIFARIMIGRWL